MAGKMEEVIRLVLQAEGAKDIDALTDALGKLDKEAQDGDAAAKALVDQLDKLAEAAAAAAEFSRLTAEIDRLQAEFDSASEQAYNLAAGLQAMGEPTKQAEAEFNRAKAAADKLGTALGQQQTKLAGVEKTLEAAGVDTGKLASENARLAAEATKAAKAGGQHLSTLEANAKAAEENARRYEQLGKAMADAREKVGGLSANLAKVGVAAGAALAALVAYKGGQFFGDAISQAASLEAALGQIDAALESTGAAAGYNREQLLAMAQGMADASNFTTEQILSAQTRMLSYTDVIGKEFPEAMQVVIDQSARLGISLEQSAEIVGKALQAPSKAMAGLAQQGFSLDESQKKLLGTLEATGRMAEAQRIMMDMLAESYGGAAKAAADGFDGQMARVGKAFDDLKIQLVQPLLQPLADELGALATSLREFAESPEFERIRESLKTAFDAGIQGAKDFVGAVDFVELADKIAAFAESTGQALAEFGEKGKETFAYLAEAVNGLGIAIDAVQTGIFGIAAALAKAAQLGAEWGALQVKLMSLVPTANLAAKAIGVDLTAAVTDLENKAGGLGAVFDEFAERTAKNARETSEGLSKIGGALGGVEAAATGALEATEEAAVTAASAAEKAAAAFVSLATSGTASAGQILESFSAAAKEMGGATDQMTAALRVALESGIISADQFKHAVAAAMDAAANSAGDATEAVYSLDEAFKRLRITSQADLQAAANEARSAFETIARATAGGEASAGDAARAWEAYARAALEAAKGQGAAAEELVKAQLRAQGAALGFEEVLKRLGLGADQTGGHVKRLSGGMDHFRDRTEEADKTGQDMTDTLGEMADAAQRVVSNLEGVSQAYLDVAMARAESVKTMDREALRQESPHVAELRRQNDELERARELIRNQQVQYDEVEQRVAQLRVQYQYISDDRLRQLAQEQIALERNQQQARANLETERERIAASREADAAAAAAEGPVIRIEVNPRLLQLEPDHFTLAEKDRWARALAPAIIRVLEQSRPFR